ncbi:MAG: 23S rRNA (adenine(2030)-N(6))-methyltransferase RlmJ [Devosiaceae bacterium]|nr:23S rRNA (adenine(2030)-N(6))-methyltransferase RlmJ [Devosiaceae bacterium MH13]
MLSYQHAYHAGNAADVHKHAVLSLILGYLTQKAKPMSYLETHAGRGLYDLGSAESSKTGEAKLGVDALLARFAAEHPYRLAVEAVRAAHGANAYPGSPLIARHFKRPGDRLQLAELHPQEHEALCAVIPGSEVHVYKEDGFPWAARMSPPTPRRGLMLIDPSYELDHDVTGIPSFLEGLHRLWPVGVIMIWYPILAGDAHLEMADEIEAFGYPRFVRHEVRFGKTAKHHRLLGSGVAVINAPWTLEADAEAIDAVFAAG